MLISHDNSLSSTKKLSRHSTFFWAKKNISFIKLFSKNFLTYEVYHYNGVLPVGGWWGFIWKNQQQFFPLFKKTIMKLVFTLQENSRPIFTSKSPFRRMTAVMLQKLKIKKFSNTFLNYQNKHSCQVSGNLWDCSRMRRLSVIFREYSLWVPVCVNFHGNFLRFSFFLLEWIFTIV
jgi:hypothetical protein